MSKFKLLAIIFISFTLFCSGSYARRVKQTKYSAVVWKYSSLTSGITCGEGLTEAVYLYPVITMNHPIAAAYWIEKMIKEERLNTPQAIIYLSPYPCYQVGKIRAWQNSNWLRYVLEKGYADEAFVIYPPYMKDEAYLKEKFSTVLVQAKQDVRLLDNISQLPERELLEDVIVVIDASYFSNQQTPKFRPDLGNLPFIIRNAVKALKAENLSIEAVIYNTSPSFPHLGDESEIQNWLLYYLAENSEIGTKYGKSKD